MPGATRRPPERGYAHRDVLDKLGWREGLALAIDESGGPLDTELADRLQLRGAERAAEGEDVDVVLATVTVDTDALGLLRRWRARLRATGGIWLLTPKRGQVGYVHQAELIALGPLAGLVDNKVCSVSERTSGLRFVIPRAARGAG